MADSGSSTPDTAARLRAHKQRILDTWASRTRDALPPARRHDHLALVDSLPDFIDELAAMLESPSPGAALAERQTSLAADHGRARARYAGWTLNEVVAEYQLFRQALFGIVEEEQPLPRADRDLLLDAIQLAVRNAVREFDAARAAERSAQLTMSETRFKQFVDAVKDYAIFTVDPNGYITSWNVGAERIKQYRPEEAIGRHFSMLYPHEGRLRDEAMGHLRTAAIEGRFRGEGMRVRKNGEHFLADVCITPIYENGTVSGFCKVVQDLTERNVLMQERDLSRSEAERLRIEAAYRERFVQTLTHDLRTPLSAVMAAAALIARLPGDEHKVRNWAHRITDAVERCDRMISDLLDAARLHAGQRVQLAIRPCNARRVVEDASDELSTRHGNRFCIEVDGSTDGHWDCDALRRVVDNLLSNALKYGEPEGAITVRMRGIEDRLLLSVHNNGTIIPVEEQANLFQAFHRTPEAEHAGQRGWGLGLTLVRGIAEAHGGTVKVESYPKEGTTFTVDLPIDARPTSEH